MNDLLIKALITVMIIDAGMHFYYDYKKNTYQSLKFLILTVLMAVSVGAALTKQETDNEPQRMKIYSYRGKKNLSGDKIREARLKQRLSQSDLAAKVQIAGVTLESDINSPIEIGTRFVTDYELKIFAKVLHVNVEWLLEETEE